MNDDDRSREELINEINLLKGEAQPRPAYAVKSKTVGVSLAVLFGFFSWLYTYKRSMAKFWIVVTLYAITPFILYGIFSTLGIISGFYFFLGLFYFSVWIWSIIDNATKPDKFFTEYPVQ